MKFYSFSDLIHYTHIKKRNDYWISQLTNEQYHRRHDGKYFINFLKISVSEDIWLLHQAMNYLERMNMRMNRWK